ncbi:hypothetical protein ACS0TY_018808 [Phlomoides rotata]
MSDESGVKKGVREEDDFVIIEEDKVEGVRNLPLCLTGKVLTGKSFNTFGFLEAMKCAMCPSKGFTAKEIGPNLFSFNFKSHDDLMEVKRREPWHFEKSLVILKEIEKGEQPSTMSFTKTNMWVRMYDLPMAARSTKYIQSIASRWGEVVEIDKDSMEGFGRSIRVKVNLDTTQPLKTGLKVVNRDGKPAWIPFKYERLPSFCFLCGLVGHMKRECDFVAEKKELLNIHDDKLPFGEWIKASPAKKASVTTMNTKEKRVNSPLQRRLFEKLKVELEEDNTGSIDNTEGGTTSSADGSDSGKWKTGTRKLEQ